MNTFAISYELQARIGQAAQQQGQSVETYLDTLLAVETKAQQNTTHNADIERKLLDDALYFLARQGWQQKGESFFRALVQYLVQALPVEYAFVTEFADAMQSKARTLVIAPMVNSVKILSTPLRTHRVQRCLPKTCATSPIMSANYSRWIRCFRWKISKPTLVCHCGI